VEFLRFGKAEMMELADVLAIPNTFRNHCRAPATTALALVLYRLSWPHRLKDCIELFGHERAWLSIVFTDVVLSLFERFWKIFWNTNCLTPECLTRYCAAVQANGEPSGLIWGFIDGTLKGICRPEKQTANQRFLYSGYKKKHGLNFQSIVTPDGLISSMAGPWEGSPNDWSIWRLSNLQEDRLLRYCFNTAGQQVYHYGDKAYALERGVLAPYNCRGRHGASLPPAAQLFNNEMAKHRISVE
jgi:hypothetical protein